MLCGDIKGKVSAQPVYQLLGAPVLIEQPGFVDRVGDYLDPNTRSGICAAMEAARASSRR